MSVAHDVVYASGAGSAVQHDCPIRPSAIRRQDVLVMVGSAVSSLALVWIPYMELAPFSGTLGFVLCWFAAFVLMYWVAERELEGPLIAADKAVAVIIGSVAIALLIPLVAILVYVFTKGWHALTWHFFTQDQSGVGPQQGATAGGGLHAIVGTLQQVGLAIVLTVPVGIATAVYMNEVGGRMTRAVRTFVNAMSGVPSIVAGLFIFTVWILEMGNRFSGFAAALAISILMLPTVTRTSEEVLRLVPSGLREASLALGSPEWRTVWTVVLPTAASGLVTAVILGVARAVGETAPLIMTSFGTPALNKTPFQDPQQSLPLFVWQQYQLQLPSPLARAWTGALVLITMVLILFRIARYFGSRKAVL
ncbi:MAG: phosphate ABC transporter permease PstA [Gaiellales bacterium]